MAKTYIPQAVDLVSHLNKYLSKNQAKMTLAATDAQKAALAELLICIATFLQNWFKPPVQP